MAYVKAVVNPVDEVSVKRVLNVPRRGIGDATIGRLDSWANTHGVAFIDALRRQDEAGVTGQGGPGHRRRSWSCSTSWPTSSTRGPARLLEAVLERSGYVAELEAERSIEAEGRLENLSELVGRGPGLRVGRRVPRAGRPGGRHRPARRGGLRRSSS